MSKKTLITFLFITIAIIVLFNKDIVCKKAISYELGKINTTKEEILKETSDKVENNNYSLNVEQEVNTTTSNVNQQPRNYNTTTSRSNELERTVVQENTSTTSKYNENTGTLKNQAIANTKTYEQKINTVFNITNQYRNEVGLNNLILDTNLCTAASVRALEMAQTQKLSHIRPDGAKCFVVLKDLNIKYTNAGENIGDGFKYPENVCKAWKESESHYKNIVFEKYNKIGIGVAQSSDGTYYWVQIFSN